jgi:hypothetical protein
MTPPTRHGTHGRWPQPRFSITDLGLETRSRNHRAMPPPGPSLHGDIGGAARPGVSLPVQLRLADPHAVEACTTTKHTQPSSAGRTVGLVPGRHHRNALVGDVPRVIPELLYRAP